MAISEYTAVADQRTLQDMRDDAMVLLVAERRMSQTDAEASALKSRYNKLRTWYAPPGGDQWPWDLAKRPGKIHISVNLLKAAVDIDSRLQSILPRLVCMAPGQDDDSKMRAEATEKLILECFEQTGWDVWLADATKVKSLLGKTIAKLFWNDEDDRPDLSVIETPENLRVGYGSSDYKKIDWCLYEYKISPLQARQQYGLGTSKNRDGSVTVGRYVSGTTHDDPLGQLPPVSGGSAGENSGPGDSDATIDVWDYWYKEPGEDRPTVCNAVIVGTKTGRIVIRRDKFPYMPDLPYIIIENDHKLGDPDGLSTIEHLPNIQEEFNRLMSHWLQLIADNADPAWQAVGPGAASVPAGIVPKSNEIIALGADIEIKPIEKPYNQVAIEQGIGALYDAFHKESGLPSITFGEMPGSQTSGRAMAVQIEAVQNRADPRRRRLYQGLRKIILFWMYMMEQKDWKLPITLPQSPNVQIEMPPGVTKPVVKPQMVDVKPVIDGMTKWEIIAPEITPRDMIEYTQSQIGLLNARGLSLERFMDNTGVDSPLEEMQKIMAERSNAALFPGDAQAIAAAAATLLQIQMQRMQMGMDAGGNPQDMANQAQGAGFLQRQNHEAQPAKGDQATGGEQAGLGPAGASPAGGSAPAIGTQQTLLRGMPNGQSQALQQTTIKR